MPFGPVVHERRFEARLHPGDTGLVDIALFLLIVRRFYVQIDQFLAIDDRHSQFLRVGRIEKHPFHQF